MGAERSAVEIASSRRRCSIPSLPLGHRTSPCSNRASSRSRPRQARSARPERTTMTVCAGGSTSPTIDGVSLVPVTVTTNVRGVTPPWTSSICYRVGQRQDFALRKIIERGRGRGERQVDRRRPWSRRPGHSASAPRDQRGLVEREAAGGAGRRRVDMRCAVADIGQIVIGESAPESCRQRRGIGLLGEICARSRADDGRVVAAGDGDDDVLRGDAAMMVVDLYRVGQRDDLAIGKIVEVAVRRRERPALRALHADRWNRSAAPATASRAAPCRWQGPSSRRRR